MKLTVQYITADVSRVAAKRTGTAHPNNALAIWRLGCLVVSAVLQVPAANADPLPPGSAITGPADFDIRLNTTVQSTNAWRLAAATPKLLHNINADDGDRAFTPGLISSRLDVSEEVTAERGALGFDLSFRAYYDPLYLQRSADTSQQTYNPISGASSSHPAKVRAELGRAAELENAFVRDGISLGDIPVTWRVGRQTVLWGESLFFASNGIAAGQAPVDAVRALTDPLAPARDVFLPVGQAVLRAELRPGLALEAYDQFEWRRDRLPGVTSYFSTTDILDVGGQQVLLGPDQYLYRATDRQPHGLGQFGAALRVRQDDIDVGLYALRYDAKLPEAVFNYINHTYHLAFPTGINTLGASASTYLGDSTLAGEISLRQNAPLAAGGGASGSGGVQMAAGGIYAAAAALLHPFGPAPPPPPPPPVTNLPGVIGYARGDTWEAQVSQETQLAPSKLWQGASLQSEIATNDLFEVTRGGGFLQRGRSHFAASLRTVFTPSYYSVLPGLDVSFPVGVTAALRGRSSIDSSQNAGTGALTVSAAARYHAVWQASLSYTHFIGGPGTQPLADRDFLALTLKRSF